MAHYMLIEMDLTTLLSNTRSLSSPRRESSKNVNVVSVEYVLEPPNAFLIKGIIEGRTDSYNVIIKFPEVKMKGRTPVNTTTGIKKISKINARNADVEVFCSCTDFLWAFNTPNYRVSALYNPVKNLRKEVPKGTSVSGYSPNPSGKPGICKHIIALADYLKEQKILNNFS
jgi:hypothetical protein